MSSTTPRLTISASPSPPDPPFPAPALARAIADDVRARNLRPVFEALIARLRDPAELDSVARDVRTLLGEGEKGGAGGSGGGSKSGSGNGEEKEGAAVGAKANEEPLDAFVAAFLHVVFETDLLAQKISVVPFMRLVPRLPDAAKVKMRDTLIPKILKFLTIKRPPDASRAEFFVHAEAFAALVHLEFVSIQGAVTTILTLLRKPDNRCAAVTMLGKTVELCAPQLVAQGDPGKMEELRKAVLGLQEEAFRYDVNYVRDSLGWTDNPITSTTSPAAAPIHPPLPPSHRPSLPPTSYDVNYPSRQSPMALTAAPPLNPPVSTTHQLQAQGLAMLVPLDSYHGHQHTILAGSGGGWQQRGSSNTPSFMPFPSLVPLFLSPLFLPSAMLVPLDSYHGHQHTILAVGVDGSSDHTHNHFNPSPRLVHDFLPILTAMLVPLDSYHGHQHTILAVGPCWSPSTPTTGISTPSWQWGWTAKAATDWQQHSIIHPIPMHCSCVSPHTHSHAGPPRLLPRASAHHPGSGGGRQKQQLTGSNTPSSIPSPCIARAFLPILTAMLVPLDSYHGHQHTILAVGVDGSSGATWSAAMDGSLIMWGGDGKPRQSLLLGSHYVCGMDLLYSPSSLLLAAAPRDDMSEGQAAANPVAPCILQLTGDEGAGGGGGGGGGAGGGGWQVTGRLDRNQTSVISCIKAIGIHPDMAFITAESMAPSDGSPASPRDRICCYDLTGAPFSSLHPVRQYTEHEDLITCLTVFPPNPNLFLSASRDATIRLWDRRTSNAVALLGSPSSSGRPQAHAGMVTALDACPASVTVASGGMDGYLKLWDLRSLHSLGNSPPLGSLNLDESPILKLASSMLPGVVAVSTVRGLYLADLSGSVGPSGGGSARLAGGFQDGRQPGRYHDIKWAHGRRLLFAGGDAMRVDVYGLQ
ncbi:unnamed protein product [Closterium sp. Naga37s-1]|nr:unnamed protein product [Closterium sp. Naga37s-1]